jgi:E3 ubiquitin-protein ligase AMFR
MTYSPNAVWWAHARLVALLLVLLFADLGWFTLCLSVFSAEGRTQVFLLVYECFTLFIDCVSGLVKNLIHFADLSRGGNWESRGAYMFYTDVIASAIVLAATLGHYVVILFIHGISLNVVDVLIFVNMRIVFLNLKTKIAAYRNYRRLAIDMDQRYPQVPAEELQQLNDSCAICREHMIAARRLPCGHIFHTACLRSWLEHNHTCPTCRHPLIDDSAQNRNAQRGPLQPGAPGQNDARPSVWSFNSNWMGWLPSLSVEVVRAGEADPALLAATNPLLAAQVSAVQGVFPDMPAPVIIRDLLVTGNPEMTINNILEGRVVAPPQPAPQQPPPQQQVPRAAPVGHQVEQAPPLPVPASPQAIPTPPSAPSSPEPSLSSSGSEFASPPSLRDSFGSSTEQRQLSLSQRKMQMLEFARKQFRDKQLRESQEVALKASAEILSASTSSSSSSSSVSAALPISQLRSAPQPEEPTLPEQASSSVDEDPLTTSGLRRRHPEKNEESALSQKETPETIETPEERRRKFLEATQKRLSSSQGL